MCCVVSNVRRFCACWVWHLLDMWCQIGRFYMLAATWRNKVDYKLMQFDYRVCKQPNYRYRHISPVLAASAYSGLLMIVDRAHSLNGRCHEPADMPSFTRDCSANTALPRSRGCAGWSTALRGRRTPSLCIHVNTQPVHTRSGTSCSLCCFFHAYLILSAVVYRELSAKKNVNLHRDREVSDLVISTLNMQYNNRSIHRLWSNNLPAIQ